MHALVERPSESGVARLEAQIPFTKWMSLNLFNPISNLIKYEVLISLKWCLIQSNNLFYRKIFISLSRSLIHNLMIDLVYTYNIYIWCIHAKFACNLKFSFYLLKVNNEIMKTKLITLTVAYNS